MLIVAATLKQLFERLRKEKEQAEEDEFGDTDDIGDLETTNLNIKNYDMKLSVHLEKQQQSWEDAKKEQENALIKKEGYFFVDQKHDHHHWKETSSVFEEEESGFFGGISSMFDKKVVNNTRCFGGTLENVFIPIAFEEYNRIRAIRYKYEVINRKEF